MTQRDYEGLARLARQVFDAGLFTERRYGQYVAMMADHLETTNPRFDRYRFLKACGII